MEKDKQKKKRSSVERMYDSVMDMSQQDRLELLKKMEDIAIDEAVARKKQSGCMPLSDMRDKIEEHTKHFGEKVGLLTGIEVIDDMTMGLAPGELTIVAGPTSAFKTGLCLNMAASLMKQGCVVGFITLEMTKEEIGTRLNVITENPDYLEQIYVNSSEQMDWKAVGTFLKNCIKKAGIEILFIDHLHYFARDLENQATELGMITQKFKSLAIQYKIPIVLISHTRKTDNGGEEREATMNDLRGSSFIAQDADIVLMVNKVRNDDGKFSDCKTKVTLNKNRNRYGVPIMTSCELNRSGLKIEERLSYEEKLTWDAQKRA